MSQNNQDPPNGENRQPGGDPGTSRDPARDHYRQGNRYYEARAWERALLEWRQASQIWRPLPREYSRLIRRMAGLRAVLGLLATVCAVYYLLLTIYPRDPFEMLMSGGLFRDRQSWWERFLDTGRPGMGRFHKMDIREWFESIVRRFGTEEEESGKGFRPTIDERWADLLRRYGRWGPLIASELDYHVVAGHGLSGAGEFDEAVAVLKRGIEVTRDPGRLGELYQGLANAYYFKGYLLQPDGLAKYDLDTIRLSAEAYEQSIRHAPRLLSMGNLGWVYFLLGDYEKAEESSLRALSYDNDLHYVRLNLGLIHVVQGRLFESFEAYRAVAARHPEDGVFMGGINDLKEVIRDNPFRHPFAHLMIGYLALQKGDHVEGRRYLETFAATPGIPARWRALGRRWMENPASAMEF